jgi:hypothetical protein
MLCTVALVLVIRLAATPVVLDTALAGADDGGSAPAIAATLAAEAADNLSDGNPQASVTVSDRDLSVIAAEENPDPSSFTHVQVRSAAGDLLLSARSQVGLLPVVVTARLSITLVDGTPQIRLLEIDVGDQVIPGFMRSWVDRRDGSLFDLGSVVGALHVPSIGVGCVAVVADGVEMGFQSSHAEANPSLCAVPAD